MYDTVSLISASLHRNMIGATLAVVGLTVFANVPAHAGDLQQQ